MFLYDELKFQENVVLKADILQESADYARNMFGIYWDSRSDGILSGVRIRANETYLIISKGIVKFKDRIYYMKDDAYVPYLHTGKKTYLRLRFTDANTQSDRVRYSTEFVLSEEEMGFPYEIELCRFISEEGAVLQYEGENFQKIFTEYNYVNVIYQPRSGEGEATVSGEITKLFANELLHKRSDDPLDIAFCFQCLQDREVEKAVICRYLALRFNRPYKSLSNEEICNQLKQILQQNAPSIRTTSTIRERADRRMIID